MEFNDDVAYRIGEKKYDEVMDVWKDYWETNE